MTDRRRPTYSLQEIKRLIQRDEIIDAPYIVKNSTCGMCLTMYEVYQEILNLENRDFYKSVPEILNNKVYQDVYRKKIKGMHVYIKFKIKDGLFFLLSFKPDENK